MQRTRPKHRRASLRASVSSDRSRLVTLDDVTPNERGVMVYNATPHGGGSDPKPVTVGNLALPATPLNLTKRPVHVAWGKEPPTPSRAFESPARNPASSQYLKSGCPWLGGGRTESRRRPGDRSRLSLMVRRADQHHRSQGPALGGRRVRGRVPVQAPGRQLRVGEPQVPEVDDVIAAGGHMGAVGAERQREEVARGA